MLWSEIGSAPQIERAGMDGSRRTVVVSRDLSWPVSLAYDFLDERVYWADEKLRCIGSTSLDGDAVKVSPSRRRGRGHAPGGQLGGRGRTRWTCWTSSNWRVFKEPVGL